MQPPTSSAPTAAPAPAAPACPLKPQRTLSDWLLGLLGLAMILLAVAVALVGGDADAGQRPGGSAPALRILEPAAGAAVGERVALVFTAGDELRLHAGGWGVDSLHLHAVAGPGEFMPSPRDLQPLGERRYRWALPALPPGEQTLQLYWSGPDHRRLSAGSSAPVQVHVRAQR